MTQLYQKQLNPDYAIAPTFRSGEIKGKIFGFLPTGRRVAKIIFGLKPFLVCFHLFHNLKVVAIFSNA